MTRRFNPPTSWHVRRQAAGSRHDTMILKVSHSDPETDEWVEEDLEVPARWEICDRCSGHGTHTNPSIDGNGISAEEWYDEWDDDDRENYMTGVYDVRCENRCDGGKVRVPDLDRCSPEVQKKVADWEEYEAESAREEAADRRLRWYEDGCPE